MSPRISDNVEKIGAYMGREGDIEVLEDMLFRKELPFKYLAALHDAMEGVLAREQAYEVATPEDFSHTAHDPELN